jgi:FKBP-type peptidyl-prolyl cis-trans isomerase SlyD
MSTDDRQIIAAGKVVSLHYTLRDGGGDVLGSSDGDLPLEYLHGADNIVVGLEDALVGHAVGDHVEVTVPPEQGYGERDEDDVQAVPRSAFPDEEEIVPGAEFVTEDEDGNPMQVWVASVDDETVMVDLNHPLAGKTLHFAVDVIDVRDASEEELEHGHPHGEDGHDDEEDEEDHGH